MGVRRKKRTPAIVPLASMGDIAFLLIIFFILASIPKGEPTLTHAEAENLGEIEQASVSVTMDENGGCFFQGKPVAVKSLTSRLKLHFEEQPPEAKNNRRVIVEIDKNLTYEVYKHVYSSVSEAGGIVMAQGIEKYGS
ncbi:MAG: biopolymer transporter ExbD [Phycisphaerales bacterium]|jgi:biopolymer transport protein ExbD|nr:biopolymer transporter ExbD [Phycisphaerales bacterium]